MKKKSALLLFTWILSALVLLMFACSKQDKASYVNQNEIPSIVQAWAQSFSKGNSSYKSNVANIIGALNYKDTLTILRPNNEMLYFIRTGIGTSPAAYLGLSKHNNCVQALGVFHAKDLEQISEYYQTHQLAAGDSLTVYGLNDKLVLQWSTTIDGKTQVKKRESMATLTKKLSEAHSQISTLSVGAHPSSYPPQPPPGCTDYYDVTYNNEGFIVFWIFVEEVCTSPYGTGGSGPSISNDILTCQAQTEDIINAEYASWGMLAAEQVSGTAGVDRTANYHWKCWTGYGWYLESTEQGYQTWNTSDSKWHWGSLSHSSLSVVGSSSYGTAVTASLNSATPYADFYSDNASMTLSFNLTYGFYCLGNLYSRTADRTSAVSLFWNINLEYNP